MGLFNFRKKESSNSKITIGNKEESMKLFEEYAKALMASDKKGSFFMLVHNNGFGGKACMGSPENFEDMFCQMFQEHPEIKELLKDIIKRYESGKAKFNTNGIKQPLGDELITAAESLIGKGNVNKAGELKIEDEESSNNSFDIEDFISGKSRDINDPLYPRYRMMDEHKKHQEQLKKKGLSDYNIDDIKERNKE